MTATRVVRIGTRASRMARIQTGQVAAELARLSGVETEVVDVATHGDLDRTTPLKQLGGTGVFVSALRDRLLDGTVDVAVHSLKDLPTAEPSDLVIAAIPRRDDPRDALIAPRHETLAALPPGARVGTGSPRREAQLLAARPDLEVVGIRGNADTRLGKVHESSADPLDAVVLAYAGLVRIGRDDAVTERLDPAVMLPAPGQGALAVECRADDRATIALLAPLDDGETRAAVTAERVLLAELEAGCSAPVGAYATSDRDGLHLRAVVFAPGGTASIGKTTTGALDEPERLGRELAAELLASGAAALMEEHA